jgi:hypothetical protein
MGQHSWRRVVETKKSKIQPKNLDLYYTVNPYNNTYEKADFFPDRGIFCRR